MSTLAEIRAAVFRNLGRSDLATEHADRVDQVINDVIRERICRDHNWGSMEAAWTRNTVADTELYSFPDPDNFKDCERILVRQTSTDRWRVLDEATENQIRFMEPYSPTGLPRVWSRRADSFRLKPTPDVSTYQMMLLGWRLPGDMASDGSTNWATIRYPSLVEQLATADAFEMYGESQRSAALYQAAASALQRAIVDDKRRSIPAVTTISPSMAMGRPGTGWNSAYGRRNWELV